MANEINKDQAKDIDSKSKVLDLQEMDAVDGGLMAWSTTSNNCGGVTKDEWSTESNGCTKTALAVK